MSEIGRADRNGIDPILTAAFARDHRLEIIIGARAIQTFACREGVTAGSIDVECASDQGPRPVLASRDTMNIADIGAVAAPHHSEAERHLRRRVCRHVFSTLRNIN